MKKQNYIFKYVYTYIASFLLLFSVSALAQFDFEMTTDSTTIEDNADFMFYFEHSSGSDYLNVMQVLIGENREDPNAIFINIRRSSGFIEVGENGQRGSFLGGSRGREEVILNGTRVRVNYALADFYPWTTDQNVLRINLSFRNKDFEGLKKVYMDARDIQGDWGGQRQVGTITVRQPEAGSTRHRPEIVSLDPYRENRADGKRVKYHLNVKDRDGREELRRATFEMSYRKSEGFLGTRRFTVNYINVEINFDDNTFTVYDLASGYYRRQTKTIGTSGRIRLDGATVDVHYILPELLEPETTYSVSMEFTFTNRWAGNYEMSANAGDNTSRYSGNKGLGSLRVEGGTEAPYSAGISPSDVNLNYRTAPGDRIPLRVSSWWRDSDGADDIKIVDIKFAKDTGDDDDIFFLRFYPNDDKVFVGDHQIDFNDREGRDAGGNWWNDNGYFHGTSLTMSEANEQSFRIDFPIEFKEGFMGDWNIYTRAMDYAENKTEWQQMGSIKVDYNGSKSRPQRTSLDFDLGIISSQYIFRDGDGPNDIETIEFVITKTRPQSTIAHLAKMTYDHRNDTFSIFSAGGTNSVSNLSNRGAGVRQVGNIRVYYPQTRMIGLVGSRMYFFFFAQLTRDVPDGLYLVYARSTNTRGNTSRWVLLSTYLHDSDTPYFRP